MTMTLRYAHLSQEHKKKAVNLLNGLTAGDGRDSAGNCHKSGTTDESSQTSSCQLLDFTGRGERI
jgi:hypothetical protein